ncbi:spliceosome ATPase-activating subunit SPP2 LALA0_S06e06370g [Lachancea lanzarotensis]|uniref:Pre-mRNA-splicing factor n=1 Tax=Lachancea lanzarotensis TaxID=1245769 RepID=A0A0C7NBG0_9SACH|nr:uncharacterized protein LALA0_S06e06370g [Lachancea lanzarotensis]CEP62898.1 LALA0S06e06370g1_1 [Lachancea lanzarotensis]
MSGFSLNLKSQKPGKKSGKSDGKKKRTNVFNDSEAGAAKKTKIRLAHVDEYKHPDQEKLVIKPIGVSRPFEKTLVDPPVGNNDLKFGLNTGEVSETDTPKSRVFDKVSAKSEKQHETTDQKDYEDVPIEAFGDALLRGMGWDGKDDTDETPSATGPSNPANSAPKFRPALLGLGAKPGRRSNTHERIGSSAFLPVIKVSKETGKKLSNG